MFNPDPNPMLATAPGAFDSLFWMATAAWGVVLVVLWTILPFVVLRMMWQNNELIAEIRALRKAILRSPRPLPPTTDPHTQNRPGHDGETNLPASAFRKTPVS